MSNYSKTWANLTEGLYAIRRKSNNELMGYVKLTEPKYCGLGYWSFNGVISKLFKQYQGQVLLCWNSKDYWFLEAIDNEFEQTLFG